MARVKWGRGKREANGIQCKCEGDEFVMGTSYVLTSAKTSPETAPEILLVMS